MKKIEKENHKYMRQILWSLSETPDVRLSSAIKIVDPNLVFIKPDELSLSTKQELFERIVEIIWLIYEEQPNDLRRIAIALYQLIGARVPRFDF